MKFILKQILFLLLLAAFSVEGAGELYAKSAKATEAARRGAQALSKGNPKSAISYLTSALKGGEQNTFFKAAIYNDRAIAFAQTGEFKKSMDDFNAALKIYPSYGAVYVNRGQVLSEQGYFDEALKDFERAAFLLPHSGEIFLNRGLAYLKQEKQALSLVDLKKAAKLMKQRGTPFFARAVYHLQNDRKFMALRYIDHGLKISPRSDLGFYLRGRALGMAQYWNDAQKNFLQASKLRPQDEAYKYALARSFEEKRQFKTAYRLYSEAIQLNSNQFDVFLDRGRTARLMGQAGKAVKDLNLYHQKKPQEADGLAELAAALVLNGQKQEGKEFLKQIKGQDSLRPSALLASALAYEKLGQIDEAMNAYKQALAFPASFKEGKASLQRLGDARTLPLTPGETKLSHSPVENWHLVDVGEGRYQGRWDVLPDLQVPLETYEKARPKLVDWTILSGDYKGFGLLRYYFVSGGTQYDFVVLIDVKKQKVIAIEPYLIGKRQANWAWQKNSVTITDLENISHKITLRAPRIIAPPKQTAKKRPVAAKNAHSEKGKKRKSDETFIKKIFGIFNF